jgi:hypothetical protein
MSCFVAETKFDRPTPLNFLISRAVEPLSTGVKLFTVNEHHAFLFASYLIGIIFRVFERSSSFFIFLSQKAVLSQTLSCLRKPYNVIA